MTATARQAGRGRARFARYSQMVACRDGTVQGAAAIASVQAHAGPGWAARPSAHFEEGEAVGHLVEGLRQGTVLYQVSSNPVALL
jgi:hypothetical protein